MDKETVPEEDAGALEVDRERPFRPRYFPKASLYGALLGAVVLVSFLGYSIYSYVNRPVLVPDVIGKEQGAAITYLKQHDFFDIKIVRQQSDRPAKEVVSQDPSPDAPVSKDSQVTLYVSAGDGVIVVPDVVGKGQKLALGMLESSGISYNLEHVISTEPSGTVISVTPRAGTEIDDDTTISLTIALNAEDPNQLLPFDLRAMTVVIDPSIISANANDAPLAIANRLQGLLEASGAKVVLTRSSLLASDKFTVPIRQQTTKAANPTVVMGIDTRKGGDEGLSIDYDKDVPTADPPLAKNIATMLAENLKKLSYNASVRQGVKDPLTLGANHTWVRIVLGNSDSDVDLSLWARDGFVDDIARSAYLAIGLSSGRPIRTN